MNSPYSLETQCQRVYSSNVATKAQRPVIGITANYGEQTAKLAEGYYNQVVAVGGVPLIIPPVADDDILLSTLNHIDGLLLTGGADINPLFQGEEPQPLLGGINAERDLPELLITRLAYNRQMPILGICRGIQTLTVALQGKVAQDLEQLGKSVLKHSQQADRHVATHTVQTVPGTTLFNIYKTTNEQTEAYTLYVNSFHHQAVKEPGPHLRVAATAPDGIIEAVDSNEQKPVLGVQWHPECMGDEGRDLFAWLVKAAKAYRQAQQLHDRILTLDTHCDTPMLFPKGIDFTTRDSRILVDLPKMTEGRLDATVMVAYIPQNTIPVLPLPSPPTTPFAYANAIFDTIEQIVDSSPSIAIARTPDDLWVNKRNGQKSIMLGIENGRALEGNLRNVRHFAKRGVVYITLCHNGDNDLCDSAKGQQTHGGVSPFGAKVIRKMNELGLMVDLSHASEKSFYDALDISRTPIVCSHSSCRALCDHPRNLTDDQLRALAQNGGVCQITLYPGFLRAEGQECCGHATTPTILDAMAHLEHAIQVAGIDHVGLGTDFDGDGGVPGLADASELLNFTLQLMRRRFSEQDIQKIWGGNFLRVMRQVQDSRAK